MRILIIGPSLDHSTGGIPAVVEGLMQGLSGREGIMFQYYEYCSTPFNLDLFKRITIVFRKFLKFFVIIKRASPTLIHMHSSIMPRGIFRDFFFVMVIKAFRIPFVYELHGGRVGTLRGIIRCIFSCLMEIADSVIVTSKEQQRELFSLYPMFQNKINLIPNPLVLSKKFFLKKRGPNEPLKKQVKIIFASRLIIGKGAAELIMSLSQLKNNAGWTAEIYGDGQEKENLRHQIRNLGLENKVSLKGNVPLNELLKVYSESDIFAFPSSHHEGFPMAFFYAVASGIAIVSSRVSPITDYLLENVNCLYADPKNTEEMARAIERLINEKELRIKMGQRNSELCRQFHPDHIASLFVELYSKMFGDGSR